MRYLIFAMRDRASDSFSPPQFNVARGSAIRAFTDAINRQEQNNPLFEHPEDFDLYAIGEYDDAGAELIPCDPVMICVGKDVAVREQRPRQVDFLRGAESARPTANGGV